MDSTGQHMSSVLCPILSMNFKNEVKLEHSQEAATSIKRGLESIKCPQWNSFRSGDDG